MRFSALSGCITILLLFCIGCSGTYSDVPIEKDTAFLFASEKEQVLEGSLFAEDQAVLSNEAIDKILSSKIQLPQNAKVSVIRFFQRQNDYWWSEELAMLDQQIMNDFIVSLQSSNRVALAEFLPSMLVPVKMTISRMRAAAARTQSDILIIYRPKIRTFTKYKFLGDDETKAFCSVEAVVMDVRTGVIPFSTVASESYFTKKTASDLNSYETSCRAEQEAIAKALKKVAAQLTRYLNSAS